MSINIELLLRKTFKLSVFQPLGSGETPIPWIYMPGDCKLVLVLGENAGGKSFFRRAIDQMTTEERNIHVGHRVPAGPFPVGRMIPVSMEARTGRMGSLIFGQEKRHSTGACSAHSVLMGIKTATTETGTNIIYWDEPDIGMSAGVAAGAGIEIQTMVLRESPLTQAVFVTSHSPALISTLSQGLNPHYVYLGDSEGPSNVSEWLQAQLSPKVVTPQELKEASRRRRRLIQKALNAKNKEK